MKWATASKCECSPLTTAGGSPAPRQPLTDPSQPNPPQVSVRSRQWDGSDSLISKRCLVTLSAVHLKGEKAPRCVHPKGHIGPHFFGEVDG